MKIAYRQAMGVLARGAGCTALALVWGGCTAPAPDDTPSTSVIPAPTVAHAAPVVIPTRPGTERLARGLHPLARPENDRGRLDPARRIANLSLFFRPSAQQAKDRAALAVAQLDPTSPSFHKWLVPETYRARFGAREDDLARATSWLAAQGFEVHRTSPLGNRVTFSARVGDLEAAFQTEMHSYQVGGQLHYAMATAPAMPSELAPVVLGLKHTHDFFPKPVVAKALGAAMANRSAASVRPAYAFNYEDAGFDAAFEVLGPPDWATAYDVTKLYTPGIGGKKLDGSGVTIGIVGTAQIAQTDVDAFRQTFNLQQRTVTMTLVPDTGPAAGGQGGGGVEAILDVEWSGGIAKGADVNYVFVGQDDGDVDDATIYIIEQNLTPLMSESYGGCEIGTPPSDADITEEYGTAANMMGITYMAAAGDSGADGCIDYGLLGIYGSTPGTYPGVTSVGGTQFPHPDWNAQGDLTSYPEEEVWNESNNPFATFLYNGMPYPIGVGAGGGGLSSVFARPLYQAGVPACDIIGSLPVPVSGPMRQTPDISASAASGTPGYFIECTFDNATGDCSPTGGMPFGTPIGGTSASSPAFTGVVAILNQAVGERLGNINPMLYQLEAANKTPSPFHDITKGSNAIVCGPGAAEAGGPPDGSTWPDSGCAKSGLQGYNAAVGYDCASGIGTVDGYNLVNAWLGAAKTSTAIVASPDMISEGTQVTLTATVTVDGTNSHAVGGIVTFAFESFAPGGGLDNTWELGSVNVADGTASSGKAVLTTLVPPGIVNPGHQLVDVVAIYGGDVNHLASTSTAAVVHFAPITFAISPAMSFVEPNGMETLTTSGGIEPVRWFLGLDTTVEFTNQGMYLGGSQIDRHGAFVAGPQSGYVEVVALDKDSAVTLAYITVGSPSVPPPWLSDAGVDAAVTFDAGHDSGLPRGVDAGRDAPVAHDAMAQVVVPDAGIPRPKLDATLDGSDEGKASDGGCGCELAKRPAPGAPVGAVFGVVLGVGLLARRRRSVVVAARR